jgi:spore maturation protein CgeB
MTKQANISVAIGKAISSFVYMQKVSIVTCLWLDMGFKLVSVFIECLQLVTSNSYNSLTDVHNIYILLQLQHT